MGINKILNKMTDVTEYVMESQARVVFPTTIGAAVGWASGVGMGKGAFQGLTTGMMISWIIKPLSEVIKRNEGEGEDQLHSNTVNLLSFSGFISTFAVSIFLTKYYDEIGVNRILPSSLKWSVITASTTEYTYMKGILVGGLPVLIQYYLES